MAQREALQASEAVLLGEKQNLGQASTGRPPMLGLTDTDGMPGYAYGQSARVLERFAAQQQFGAASQRPWQTTARGNQAQTAAGSASVSPVPGQEIPAVEGDESARTSEAGYEAEASEESASRAPRPLQPNGEPLSDEQMQMLDQLQRRDTEVRTHEQAHLAAGGGLTRGGANFSYTTGPDGRRYATGGDVSIDVSEGRSPEETVRRMQQVRAAALAPANPSNQDRRVAASANLKSTEARQEMVEISREEAEAAREARTRQPEDSTPADSSEATQAGTDAEPLGPATTGSDNGEAAGGGVSEEATEGGRGDLFETTYVPQPPSGVDLARRSLAAQVYGSMQAAS